MIIFIGLFVWLFGRAIGRFFLFLFLFGAVMLIFFPSDDSHDKVVKDMRPSTSPLVLRYNVADRIVGTNLNFSISNNSNDEYQDVDVQCSYDYIGYDRKLHRAKNVSSNLRITVEANSTFTSETEFGHKIFIEKEDANNISCSIPHGIFSGPMTMENRNNP